MVRRGVFIVALLGALSAPAVCLAEPGDDGPALLTYGFRGFWTGAELGLAVGFLSTGDRYGSGEWRKLVLGLGIGAIVGVASGVTLAIVDASDASRPRYGWFVLRDMGYGALLGALTGAAVGMLVWVADEEDGRAKDVLIGLSIGALIGAAAGAVFGVVEGIGSKPRKRATLGRERGYASRGLHFSLIAVPERDHSWTLGPAVVGRF